LCAIKSGNVYCWGRNDHAQLGRPKNAALPVNAYYAPEQVAGLSNVTQLAASYGRTCAVSNGGLYCWGRNLYGEIGVLPPTDPKFQFSTVPIEIFPPGSGVTDINITDGSTCAVKSQQFYCWGSSLDGQLGIGIPSGYSESDLLSINTAPKYYLPQIVGF
jgi:alpha-tubulin suppressor-like RCC1 family protein